CMQDLEFPWTF
nr:immunoglobulin light chain junction region [Macaca mulatta]MOW55793.1 immunoglobulin light chain junction region [Macaca mulatta]MOX25350.1 immunoglobulin light chain junction region [Macaca mulatta]MOY02748.1 immunoglobulin light chain junction region [Macaca mulatta]MOY12167.1 immunoglobulin light chain junction region [Macaca mulatta]